MNFQKTWTPPEEQKVLELIASGDSVGDMFRAYVSWQKANGFKRRSYNAFRYKMTTLGRKPAPRTPIWTPAEDANLFSYVGSVPFRLIVQAHNDWAKREGKPTRSAKAIRVRISKNQAGSLIPCGDYLTTGSICRMLKCSDVMPRRWLERGWIKGYNHKGCHYDEGRKNKTKTRFWYYRRKDLVKMAKERPEAFAGCKKTDLFLLLENEELAEMIVEKFPYRPGTREWPVRCVETGAVFKNCSAAAAYVNKNCVLRTTRASIYAALKGGWAAGDLHWEKV